MKNLLNLKGLCRSSQLAVNSDGRTTVERRSNDGYSRRHLSVGLTKLLSLFLLLALGIGQIWASRTFKSGEVIYFKDTWKANGNSGTWKIDDSGNGKLCAYFYGDGEYWVNCVTIITGSWNEANALYAFTVPGDNKTYTGVIFTRGTATNWTNTWNQTMNQTPDEGKDLFCVNNTTTKNDNKDKYNGTWYTFSQYAYIEGRFHVQTAPGSNTWTNTFSTGDWNESSTAIPMTWDATNKRFYLHTYATLKNLTDKISNQGPVFYIKTAHISANLTDGTGGYDASYQANTSTNFTSSNGLVGSKIQLHTSGDGRANSNLKFDYSSGTNGYVVLYFTPSDGKIWYELEYQVNFGKGTGGNTVTATAGSSLNSGDCVLSGTSVTFAHTANTGYTWAEWNAAANGSGTRRSTDQSYTVTINGSNTTNSAFTAYSKYTENKSNITIGAGDNGRITTPASLSNPYSLGVATKQAITATADGGYYFTGWTCTGTAAVDNPSSASTYAKTNGTAGGTGTVTANFAKRFVLRGSREDGSTAEGMPLWSVTESAMNVSAGTSTQTVTLLPNRTYKYMIYDKKTSAQKGCSSDQQASATQPAATAWELHNSNPVYFNTAGHGTYTFTVTVSNDNPSVTITNPASSQITIGTTTWTEGEGTVGTGGTVSAVDDEGYTIETTNYVRNGGNVIFTATANPGYTFMGWYNADNYNPESNSPVSTANPYTISSITSAQTVYALFKETLYDVTVNDGATTTTAQVGVVSHPEITAVSPAGKVFKRWDISGSATLDDEYSKTTTITGVTHHGVTITATFQDPPTLYYVIDHVSSGWAPTEMYVYFYNNEYWDDKKGTGSGTGCLTPAGRAMTAVEGKGNKWWKYTFDPERDPALVGQTITTVSFMSMSQNNYGDFSDGNTGTHRLYQSCMNMFVVTTSSGQSINNCWYYNDGYWYNYKGEKSGYYIHNLGDDVEFIADENGVYTASVNLEAGDRYFYIGGCDSKNWASNSVFDANSTSHQLSIYDNVSGDGNKVHLKANVGGIYRFKLSPVYNPDNDNAHMHLEIEFPVSAGEYRAVYNNAASSPTKSRPSNSIKGDQSSGTVSLWLNAGTNYITFEASAVNVSTGALTWSAVGSQQTVTGIAAAGVYTMTLTKDGSTYGVSNIQPYTGSYYIRTDCAPGKWKEYTSNALAQNKLTYKAGDATTYDYYLCKYAANNTNVRCVIANDYNLAVSDTLKDDEILNHGRVGTYETLPAATNVRFSWNSSTNTLKRAYLLGSTEADNYLNINPIEASKIYKTDGTTDLHGTTAANRKFTDLNNWVYMLEIMAVPNGTASITATYNGDEQVLLAATKMIGSTNETSNKYTINIIYDYKLNNLITAWKPDPDKAITDKLKDVDMLWVRNAQSAADGLTLGTGGSLENVTVMGAIRLNYDDFNRSYMSTWNENSRPKLMHFISFPFPVNVGDIFGLNDATYGREYVIKKYDSERRALQGAFEEDDHNFWKDLTTEDVMEANRGYCLVFDNDIRVGGPMGSKIWENKGAGDFVYLYFPTKTVIGSITNANCTTPVAEHLCGIDREFTIGKTTYNHIYTDSHWNLIGMPMFNTAYVQNYSGFNAFYQWNNDNTWTSQMTSGTQFKPMHSYMVQYHGDVIWSITNPVSAGIAARKTIASMKSYTMKLELWQNGATEASDWAFVEMREGANKDFVLCEDLFKIENTNRHNIVVYAGNYDVAYSQVPVENQTIPVGVIIRQNGTYTFSMPSNFDGTVTLIDKFAQTRTNLALGDYEVTLERGTINDRFELEINIRNVPTAIDGVTDGSGTLKDGKAHKFIENGAMYILRDGQVFDALGNKVK